MAFSMDKTRVEELLTKVQNLKDALNNARSGIDELNGELFELHAEDIDVTEEMEDLDLDMERLIILIEDVNEMWNHMPTWDTLSSMEDTCTEAIEELEAYQEALEEISEQEI